MSQRNDRPHKIADILRAIGGVDPKKKYTSAVILAAGSSTRMGGGATKQFLELDGIPIVARTVLAFEGAECIDEIIVVAKADEVELYSDFPSKYGISKPFSVVCGGETRQESARIGQDSISKDARFVCIHDAARCLVTEEMITRACRGAYMHGAATLAVKATDTVKISDKNMFIDSTPDRKFTYQAQTPQVFSVNAYRAAAYVAVQDKIEVTDDNMLFENIKVPVKIVEGSRENIKITEPVDMIFAKAILELRGDAKK